LAPSKLTHALVAGIVAMTLAPAALAGGEPKNEWPFTRPVTNDRAPAQVATTSSSDVVPQGEPKNEPPFTRPVAEGATIVLRDKNGFAWLDAAVGAIAGLGIALVVVGALTLRLPRRQAPRHAL
jgi:hypothetical protein